MIIHRALVTGSAGFVGRHMVAELRKRRCQVVECDVAGTVSWDALDLFRTDPNRYDLVVHCAARAPHRAAIDGQASIFPYNMLLDAAMFDWAIRTGQRRVLYFSSSAAYPVGLQHGSPRHQLSELDLDPSQHVSTGLLEALGSMAPLAPDASYGWAKLTGERMADAARAAGLPVTVVRPFSGYGGDQGIDWPFGAFLERVSRRMDPFPVWGDGTQVRDWIHVSDLVRGALAVAESGTDLPVNLCTGVGTSMAELIELMASMVGYRPTLQLNPNRPTGVAYRVGCPSRLNNIYMPRVDLEHGLKLVQAGRG